MLLASDTVIGRFRRANLMLVAALSASWRCGDRRSTDAVRSTQRHPGRYGQTLANGVSRAQAFGDDWHSVSTAFEI